MPLHPLVGDPALANPIPRQDLGGRTVRIRVVPGARSLAPRPQIGRNPDLPPEHPLAPDDVAVLLFPTPTRQQDARQVVGGQDLLVLPVSAPRPDEVGFIVNELMQHYRGVRNLEFTRREAWLERMTEKRDLDTVRKVGLRDAYGDALNAAGDWHDAALGDLLRLYHEIQRLSDFLDDPILARAAAGITRAPRTLRDLQDAQAITESRASQLTRHLEKAQYFAISWRAGMRQALD